jgi:transposase
LQKTYYQSFISTHVDKWVEGRTSTETPKIKTLAVQFFPTIEQKVQLDRDLQTSNYTYNKAIEYINSGQKVSKYSLRDALVTNESRKSNNLLNKVNSAKCKIEAIMNELKKVRTLKNIVKRYMIKEKCWKPIKKLYDANRYYTPPIKNDRLKDFELLTHKDIRTGSVFEAFTNFVNNTDAIKAGRIKFFRLKFRSKKKNGMSMTLSNHMININNGVLRLTSRTLTDKMLRVNIRSQRKLRTITSLKDCRITKKNGKYHIRIPIDIIAPTPEHLTKIIGIDPGVSTFLSCYTPDRTVTIKQSNRCTLLDKLLSRLKYLRREGKRSRIRKKSLNKIDQKKKYITNELHWKSINYLVKNYDIIFIEKFDSQGFVKNSRKNRKNKGLNRNTNNLKPYQFRQRLIYKALSYGKIVEVVKAHNTTRTCSNCGNLQDMKLSNRVYNCSGCKQVFDRDFNAAKNMILKGLLY